MGQNSITIDRTFQCLLFDLGHTLWYRDERDLSQLEREANQRAIDILRQTQQSSPLLSENDSEAGRLLRDMLLKQFKIEIEKDPYIEPLGSTMVQQVLHASGWQNADPALGQAIFDALQVNIARSRRLFADTISTLQKLQTRGFQMGIVTNRYWGGVPFREDLQRMGLLTYLDYGKMAISADLHIRKPNPDIFLHALNACNADVKTTMMVGDSLIADVAGSQQLGIFAVWKPQNYAEIQAHMEANEGISVAEYNQRQMDLFKKEGLAASLAQRIGEDEYPAMECFARGHIRPQLIIDNLSELLSWL
ncbi:HAD family hydrolase [Dictyobacter halimunensis]|uniref:HAD family hydrolase n=1 Tax=Dictyobacter halimunensis TaxID=3026934 RepID=UPI0030C6EAEB